MLCLFFVRRCYRPRRASPRRPPARARRARSPGGSSRVSGSGRRPSGGRCPCASAVRSSARAQSTAAVCRTFLHDWDRVRALSPEGSRTVARILIVDDESSMRFLLRTTFELDGHDVDEAAERAGRSGAAREQPELRPGRDRLHDAGDERRRADRPHPEEPGHRGDPDHPHQLEPRLGAAHGSGRVLPQAVRPAGAAGQCATS